MRSRASCFGLGGLSSQRLKMSRVVLGILGFLLGIWGADPVRGLESRVSAARPLLPTPCWLTSTLGGFVRLRETAAELYVCFLEHTCVHCLWIHSCDHKYKHDLQVGLHSSASKARDALVEAEGPCFSPPWGPRSFLDTWPVWFLCVELRWVMKHSGLPGWW